MEKKALNFLNQLSSKTNMSHLQVFNKYKNSPVCPRCMRPAYRDRGWRLHKTAACPKCGWHGNTVTLDTFITNKYYR